MLRWLLPALVGAVSWWPEWLYDASGFILTNAHLVSGTHNITSFGGAEIYNRDELLQRLVLQHPGDIVPVAVSRAGQTLSLSLTLTESRAP